MIIFALGLAGCGHKPVKEDGNVPAADAVTSTSLHGSGDGASSDQGNAQGLQTVHFGFDSNTLTAEAKRVLQENAKILKAHPGLSIQIEGHCDQRGGIQYNIALGERRAVSTKHFLEDQGVAPGRINTISYGKERPIDSAETEEAYARNRRANFVITKSMG